MILVTVLKTLVKKVLLGVMSEKFLEWLLFWAAKSLVESTKTKKDDEFFTKIKEVYDGPKSNGTET